ncbi:hypothetical protein PG996_004710 [Apiospora saccharicola]|uniref:Ankyrin repeat protein n=1 Tax=Apiospora saccharicola TaxID=335842 RepID=A0ABR1W4Z2_9PEZI
MIKVALAAARTKNLEMMKLAVKKVSEEGTRSFGEWVLPAVTSATVLNRAAAHGSVKTFRLLLQSGASMRHPGVLALHTAAASHEEDRISVMEYLLDELGVDLEGLDGTDSESTPVNRHDIYGKPLHYAIGNSQWVTVNWLVRCGADLATKN